MAGQRIDFLTSRFYMTFKFISLLGNLLLLNAVSETLLGSKNSHPMALDEYRGSQRVFNGFRELTLQRPQGGANRFSISNQLADVLT
jgi:hypothetical protein